MKTNIFINTIAPLFIRGWRHWYDIHTYAGWKIQKNALHSHKYRLTAPDGTKTPYHSEQACRDHIQTLKRKGLKPTNKHLIIIVPGLNNVLSTFHTITKSLRNKGYDTIIWDYPSNRANTHTHAERLTTLIKNLEKTNKVSFVTHSLGGLILRTALADKTLWTEKRTLGDIVMIAPPHKGSFVADIAIEKLKLNTLFDLLTGEVGHDLTTTGAHQLPDLKTEVCIIVGGSTHKFGFNPLTKKDNDGLVALDSSKVDTATEFIQIPYWSHTLMLMSKKTSNAIINFFESKEL